jgi:hypothetical protein
MAFKFTESILLKAIGLSHRDLKANMTTIAQAIQRTEERFSKEGWEKYFAALRIAVDAGVLKECTMCTGSYFDGNGDIESAYKMGSAEFASTKYKGTFDSRQEMMDVIKFVIDDNSRKECEGCTSARPGYQRAYPRR